ncbi:MAG: toll/interleukin-1 receptor domain-containing protein [Balneola sp.]|tara:strand:- start:6884 stop:7420 length:537 start_codon:yes stop_codon:yes gene_type:complete
MAKISRWDLNYYSESDYWKNRAHGKIWEYRVLASKTIFLSHSHKDKKLATGLANLLASLNIDLYIDWQDNDLPGVTNRETAEQIKSKIKTADIVMLLATDNSMKSRWVPWEIGIADSSLGEGRIVIVPMQESNDDFYGNEYLQIYRRLEYDDIKGLRLFEPQYEHVSDDFSDYLLKLG